MDDAQLTPAQPEQPQTPAAQPEILSDTAGPYDLLPLVPNEPSTRRRTLLAVGAGVVAVAVVGAGAAVAVSALGGGGGGAQPEQMVPASAVGFVSIDLDPSLGQKVDALRFLRAFPSAKAALGGNDDLRELIFDEAKSSDPSLASLNYATDVKPWIGDRFGVAALPGHAKGGEPDGIVVLQVTDAGKARSGLKKLMSTGDGAGGACTVAEGYAVCGQSAAVVTSARAAAAQHSLADNPEFQSDVKGAGGRGIALAWGDLGQLAGLAADSAAPAGSGAGLSQLGKVSGRVTAEVRFDGANLEVTGRVSGAASSITATGSGHGTGVEQLPAGTLVAAGDAGGGPALTAAFAQARKSLSAPGVGDELDSVTGALEQYHLHLPGDLATLLGTKFAVAYGGMGSDGMPKVGIRGNAADAKAGPVLTKIDAALRDNDAPFTLDHRAATGGGYAAALSPAYAAELAAGGHLGTSASFRSAVPDASSAAAVMYVDVAGLLRSGGLPALGESPQFLANARAISAIGLTASEQGNGSTTFQLRVITH